MGVFYKDLIDLLVSLSNKEQQGVTITDFEVRYGRKKINKEQGELRIG